LSIKLAEFRHLGDELLVRLVGELGLKIKHLVERLGRHEFLGSDRVGLEDPLGIFGSFQGNGLRILRNGSDAFQAGVDQLLAKLADAFKRLIHSCSFYERPTRRSAHTYFALQHFSTSTVLNPDWRRGYLEVERIGEHAGYHKPTGKTLAAIVGQAVSPPKAVPPQEDRQRAFLLCLCVRRPLSFSIRSRISAE